MLGLFRQNARYELVEVDEDSYLIRFRIGSWPFYRYEYETYENKLLALPLRAAKDLLRQEDLYYYEDFQIIKLKDIE